MVLFSQKTPTHSLCAEQLILSLYMSMHPSALAKNTICAHVVFLSYYQTFSFSPTCALMFNKFT